ncbi:hypothetical protein JOB18_025077 [Solea senegalensis]|uniref:Uncharacterized protein n=1 Tax=Solea senegalensis TaxID=28829 RepID=A0AAV6RDC0_SOLSE|nr:hypothetical protein JOB18_025077 [Solea senegalensis]
MGGREGKEQQERERWGRGLTDVELQRFGGQTNKQTMHRFPAALRHSRGNLFASAIRLRSSPLMLKTALAGGSPSSTPPPPPPCFSPVNSHPQTSLRDSASEVNRH